MFPCCVTIQSIQMEPVSDWIEILAIIFWMKGSPARSAVLCAGFIRMVTVGGFPDFYDEY